LTFNIYIHREEFIIFVMLNQDKHSSHVKSTGQRYDKIWNSAAFVCGKTWVYLKKWPGGSHSMHSLQV